MTSSDKISRELDLDTEKARAIKQRFESGGFNDENQPPKSREVVDTSLFNDGMYATGINVTVEGAVGGAHGESGVGAERRSCVVSTKWVLFENQLRPGRAKRH